LAEPPGSMAGVAVGSSAATSSGPLRSSLSTLGSPRGPFDTAEEAVNYYGWRPKRSLSTQELEEMEIEQKRLQVKQMIERNRRFLEKNQGSLHTTIISSMPTPLSSSRRSVDGSSLRSPRPCTPELSSRCEGVPAKAAATEVRETKPTQRCSLPGPPATALPETPPKQPAEAGTAAAVVEPVAAAATVAPEAAAAAASAVTAAAPPRKTPASWTFSPRSASAQHSRTSSSRSLSPPKALQRAVPCKQVPPSVPAARPLRRPTSTGRLPGAAPLEAKEEAAQKEICVAAKMPTPSRNASRALSCQRVPGAGVEAPAAAAPLSAAAAEEPPPPPPPAMERVSLVRRQGWAARNVEAAATTLACAMAAEEALAAIEAAAAGPIGAANEAPSGEPSEPRGLGDAQSSWATHQFHPEQPPPSSEAEVPEASQPPPTRPWRSHTEARAAARAASPRARTSASGVGKVSPRLQSAPNGATGTGTDQARRGRHRTSRDSLGQAASGQDELKPYCAAYPNLLS